MAERLRTRPAEEWLAALEAARVPCGRINNFAQALYDAQVRHRNMFVPVPHPLGGSARAPGNPLKFSADDDESYAPPPLLAAHTRTVFQEWTTVPDARVAAAIAAGALQATPE